ncbi:DNA-directed RNA polymerase subunit M/transcription elongation factor TFIIS [Paenibacillus shirakamiensis]|uniref:DNA-directed RNA polymerase subunit M/transcription elongation factor TFIIS n=1 Tax=Paenibacillus shirakamiensis TaxID=1265935 RepID=A0ABS4JFI4_9BACL|nr:hypothetical protein [Paenibacillus shirakamiensis]MBP2000469.1 DNA-directed RNA polymerase subunit M/transcription elongation factor TFIIS [Paenibacillus shirakamiensis]
METTICPWCQTEIVWDEEIGPEEECPHCHNELKGYRTLQIDLGEEEESGAPEDMDEDPKAMLGYWGDEEEVNPRMVKHINTFSAAGSDPLEYESAVEKRLNQQEDVPECPQCRAYMLYAGQEQNTAVATAQVTNLKPILEEAYRTSVYVCPSCFHVSRFLVEEDKLRMIQKIIQP